MWSMDRTLIRGRGKQDISAGAHVPRDLQIMWRRLNVGVLPGQVSWDGEETPDLRTWPPVCKP